MSATLDPLEGERGRLFSLAYRMLGSAGEAEDMVQDAYLRWYAQPRDDVANPPGFLTTIVTNLCLDELRSARRRRQAYPGVWLPEPVAGALDEVDTAADPQQDLQRLESISLAFLSVLESLGPLERAVFVLAEVFDYSHAEVGAMLGRTPEACRQVLRRAKQAIGDASRVTAPAARHRELLASFLSACRNGDIDALARLLADDVVSRADGGGHATAANRPVCGVRAVSRLFASLAQRMPSNLEVRIELVNGWPAALMTCGGTLLSLVQVRTGGDRIERIDTVLNPAKLGRVAAAFSLRTDPLPI